ncbi:MAG: hypothetical protein M4D80_40380 [Myxococcota bacterium]|nr:hypothetical protein [Myxococcota bacterium]
MRFAVAIASLGLAGCFYVESINQRPSLDITQPVVGDIFRSETVSFKAVVVDPDGHDVDLTWRAYLCTDASTFESCDDTTDIVGEGEDFTFMVPRTRLDGETPTGGLRLVLDGRDDHGATAKPTDQLQLAVKDRNPELTIRDTSVYHQMGKGYVVDMPINLYALFTDGDDDLDSLVVDWRVLPPSLVTVDLTDDVIASPPGKKQVAKILKPQIPGLWGLSVTVTDPGGRSITKEATLNVIPDSPPCIDVVSPIVPPAPSARIVEDTELFQVPIVGDDLDSYPRTAGGALFGESTFQWSILGPTGGRQIVGGGSKLFFDPDIYTPGSIVEIRVEIQDRRLAPVNCADANQTCSIGANGCIQRQTWRVEAR